MGPSEHMKLRASRAKHVKASGARMPQRNRNRILVRSSFGIAGEPAPACKERGTYLGGVCLCGHGGGSGGVHGGSTNFVTRAAEFELSLKVGQRGGYE